MNILTSPARVQLIASLEKNNANYQKTLEQASSGYKYTCCADNVIAYSKNAQFDSKLSQNDKLEENISVGYEALGLVSNAQESVYNKIIEIKELCLQASNETYSTNQKDDILNEVRAKLDYIDYVAFSTDFNDKKLLDGSCTYYQIQFDSKQVLDVSSVMTDVHCDALEIEIDPEKTGENWSFDEIQEYITKLDTASNFIVNTQVKAGAFSMALENALESVDLMNENYTESKSVVYDVDYAKVASKLVQEKILQELSVNVMVQSNQMAASKFSLLYPNS